MPEAKSAAARAAASSAAVSVAVVSAAANAASSSAAVSAAVVSAAASAASSGMSNRTAHQQLVVEATGHTHPHIAPRVRSRRKTSSSAALLPEAAPQRAAEEVCPKVERFGGDPVTGYGAWTLCASVLHADATAFSVGIGPDASFDVDFVRRYEGAHVLCLDPTIDDAHFERAAARRNATASELSRLTFKPWGLGRNDDVLPFYHSRDPRVGSLTTNPHLKGYQTSPTLRAPILRLQSLYKMGNVSAVDVLKVDIEGAEWLIFDAKNNELRSVLRHSPPGQIALEFHDRFLPGAESAKGGARDFSTRARHGIVQLLANCGFVQRHMSKSAEEVLFVLDTTRAGLPSC